MNKLLNQVSIGDLPIIKFYGSGSAVDIVANIINFLLALAGAAAVLFIVWGGIQYISAAGSPDRVESAKKTIYNAVIGTVVIILALVIVNTIKRALGS